MSDINITVTDRDKNIHKIIAPTDMAMNLMELIKAYELAPEGTIGVCGGMAMCASCLCHINSKHKIIEKGEDEIAMLSEVFQAKDNSRLSCQIYIDDSLDGLDIELAEEI